MGLFKLRCQLPQTSDWIAIGDCSVSIGIHKVILVLGIRLAAYRELVVNEQILSLRDVEPLHMSIVESCNSDAVYHAFQQAEARVGRISQICIDGGSDMQKGASLFKEAALHIDPERLIAITYDAPHKTGCLLKKRLDNNNRWQSFLSLAASSKLKVQQTKLAHLAPPNQRSKCRYMNIDQIVSWSEKALMLFDIQDRMQKGFYALVRLKKCESENDNVLISVCTDTLQEPCSFESGNDMIQLSKDEYELFLKNFGWLNEYREDINLFARYALIGATVRDEVRKHGLHIKSRENLDKRLFDLPLNGCREAYDFCGECLDFIEAETKGLKEGELLLGTDEVIESLFGLTKSILYEEGKHGLTSFVLAAAAACGPLNEELIGQAFERVKDEDVEEWSRKNLSKTHFSKRRYHFKTAEAAMTQGEKVKAIFSGAEKIAKATITQTVKIKSVFLWAGLKVTGIIRGVCEKAVA
jgi:hypothetical protein